MRKLTSLFAALALLAAISAPSASAGTYEVELCTQNGGAGDGLTFSLAQNTVGFHPVQLCGPAGQIFGLFADEGTEVRGRASFTLTAPAETTIKKIDAFRSTTNPWPAQPSVVWEATKENGGRLERIESTVAGADVSYEVNSKAAIFSLFCSNAGCPLGPTRPAASLSHAVVTIEDIVRPNVRIESMVPGPARGTVQIPFRADDAGGGIHLTALFVDDRLATLVEDPNGGRCVPPFRFLAPCQPVITANFPLDTTKLSNGPHKLQVVVGDAGNLQDESAPVTLMVDNTPPATPPDTPKTPAPGTPPGGKGPDVADAAPALSGVSLSRKTVRPGKAALLRFVSSKAATLTVAVTPTSKRKPVATLTRAIGAGAGSLRLGPKVGKRALRPGAYGLTVRLRDADGRASAPRTLRLRVLPR